jgi:hypothetical protein
MDARARRHLRRHRAARWPHGHATLEELEAEGYAGLARDLPEGTDESNLRMVDM